MSARRDPGGTGSAAAPGSPGAARRMLRHGGPCEAPPDGDGIDGAFAALVRIVRAIERDRCSDPWAGLEADRVPW